MGDTDGGRPRKVSLRASDDRVDVSRIAREQGGGGHRQAAGFSTAMTWDELVAFLREEVAEQLAAVYVDASGVILYDKPAGVTSTMSSPASAAARTRRKGRPLRDARSVRDGVAGPGRSRDGGRAAVP